MAQNDKIEMTQKGYEDLVKELDYYKNVLQKENIEALKDARSQGDLSENADYDAARDQQAKIAGRIKELEYQIKNAVILGVSKVFRIQYLSNVEEDEDDTVEFTLVGSLEADPLAGKLSTDSPLGKAVLDAKEGDTICVTPESNQPFYVKVLSIK